MSKKERGKDSKAITPRKEISLDVIARLFHIDRWRLFFGIAETLLEDDAFDYLPVVLVHDTDLHISLVSGIPMKRTDALGFVQNFIKADVEYIEKEDAFAFIVNSRVLAKIRVKNLCQLFGEDIVKH